MEWFLVNPVSTNPNWLLIVDPKRLLIALYGSLLESLEIHRTELQNYGCAMSVWQAVPATVQEQIKDLYHIEGLLQMHCITEI